MKALATPPDLFVPEPVERNRTVPEPSKVDPSLSVSDEATLEEARQRSLPEDVKSLASHARAYAQAEFEFQKSRAAFVGDGFKTIAINGVAAVVFIFFALMALVFGLVLTLGQYLTFWGSTAAVVGLLLAAAVTAGLRARGKWQRVSAALTEQD